MSEASASDLDLIFDVIEEAVNDCEVTPSVRAIVAETGLPTRTVELGIRALAEVGRILIETTAATRRVYRLPGNPNVTTATPAFASRIGNAHELDAVECNRRFVEAITAYNAKYAHVHREILGLA